MSDEIPMRSHLRNEAGVARCSIAWSEAFSVGIRDIDDELTTLVVAFNEPAIAIAERRGAGACVEPLREISAIARIHLARGAGLISISACCDMGEHGCNAAQLIAGVVRVEECILQGWTAVEVDRVWFLRDWITGHDSQTCALR